MMKGNFEVINKWRHFIKKHVLPVSKLQDTNLDLRWLWADMIGRNMILEIKLSRKDHDKE